MLVPDTYKGPRMSVPSHPSDSGGAPMCNLRGKRESNKSARSIGSRGEVTEEAKR